MKSPESPKYCSLAGFRPSDETEPKYSYSRGSFATFREWGYGSTGIPRCLCRSSLLPKTPGKDAKSERQPLSDVPGRRPVQRTCVPASNSRRVFCGPGLDYRRSSRLESYVQCEASDPSDTRSIKQAMHARAAMK